MIIAEIVHRRTENTLQQGPAWEWRPGNVPMRFIELQLYVSYLRVYKLKFMIFFRQRRSSRCCEHTVATTGLSIEGKMGKKGKYQILKWLPLTQWLRQTRHCTSRKSVTIVYNVISFKQTWHTLIIWRRTIILVKDLKNIFVLYWHYIVLLYSLDE